MRLADLLLLVMSQASPTRVIAGSHASASTAVFSAKDTDPRRTALLRGERTITVEVHAGGMGARPAKDGVNGIRMHGGNAMTMTVEYLELSTPVRVIAWEIVPDTGGAGRWRGGCATKRPYEILNDDTLVTFVGERAHVAPYGLFGGEPGQTASFEIQRADGPKQALSAKGPPFTLDAGDRLFIQTSGGGGYGDPAERESWRVRDDVLNGYVSAAAARRAYGRDSFGDEPTQAENGRPALAEQSRDMAESGDWESGDWRG